MNFAECRFLCCRMDKMCCGCCYKTEGNIRWQNGNELADNSSSNSRSSLADALYCCCLDLDNKKITERLKESPTWQ